MSDVERKTIVLAVTGGIACGKSEVGRILSEMDFAVCDADRVAHNLMARGTEVYQKTVDVFGEQILSEGDEISRPVLGKIVFKDSAKREILNSLVHPAVRKSLKEWVGDARSRNKNCAVLIPLLFESGMQDIGWKSVICVSSNEENFLQRLKQRGLNAEEAEQRIRSQMPLKEKEKLADVVIRNDGTLEELEEAARKTVEAIVGER